MNEAITVELQFFLISILWGAIILMVYDILRILRRLIPHNSIFLALEDLIFWVLTSLFIFAMIYTMNNGTIRGFSVMGMGIGMTLYHFIFSDFFVKWVTKALLLLLRPISLLIGRIRKVLAFVVSKLKKVFAAVHYRLNKSTKSVKIIINRKRQIRAAKKSKRRELKAEKKAEAKNRKREARQKKKGSDKPEGSDHRSLEGGNQAALHSRGSAGYRSARTLRSGTIGRKAPADHKKI